MEPFALGTGLKLLMVIASALVVVGGFVWVAMKTKRIEAAQTAQAEAFERELLQNISTNGLNRATLQVQSNGHSVNGEKVANVALAESFQPRNTSPPTATNGHFSLSTTDSSASLSPLAQTIISQLQAANLLTAIDGPIRSRNPELAGTIVVVRGNKKIAILDQPLKPDDPDAEMMLNFLDGVAMPGPGKEPLFVKRFQYFLSEQITSRM